MASGPVPMQYVLPAGGPSQPRVSPDGRTLAYLIGGQIKLQSLEHGASASPLSLTASPTCSAGTEMGGGVLSWTKDGQSIVFISQGKPYIVPACGGIPRPLTTACDALLYAPVPMGDGVALCVEDQKHIGLCSLALKGDGAAPSAYHSCFSY